MSAAVATGHVFDMGLLSLSRIFAKTGGKLPRGKKPEAYYLSVDYYTKVWSLAERSNITHLLLG